MSWSFEDMEGSTCYVKDLHIFLWSLGPEPTLFGKPKFSCMRLHYRYKEASGYFHTLRAVIRNPEEDGKGKEMKLLSGNFLSALISTNAIGGSTYPYQLNDPGK